MADITSFNFGTHAVRVITRNNQPWFVANDVCQALGYSNTSKAIGDHLDDDERYNESLERGGSLLLINESGLYALVLRSRKPQARKFAKWVTSEVLPSIRTTGVIHWSFPHSHCAARKRPLPTWLTSTRPKSSSKARRAHLCASSSKACWPQ